MANIFDWATDTGSTIVGAVVPTAAEYTGALQLGNVSYGLIKYTFNAVDLSSVIAGHVLNTAGMAEAENNASGLSVYTVSNVDNTITVLSTVRTDASKDETGATGTGSVTSSAAAIQKPTDNYILKGFKAPEKPSDAYWNWVISQLVDVVSSLAPRADIAAWEAVDRTGATPNYELVEGFGIYRYDESSTLSADGETVLEPTTGGGRGILEVAHPDAIWSYTTTDYNEALPVVVDSLDFASISAGAVGTLTVTVPGAEAGDLVSLAAPSGINAGLIWCGYVSADDTVTIRIYNSTGGAIDPAEADWAVEVTKPNRQPALSIGAIRIYIKLIGTQYTSGTLETDLSIGTNEAAFRAMIESTWRRKQLLADAAIKAVIQGSALANAAMEDKEGPGY